MKKKFILFALILSVLCIGGGKINSLNAQETITIGSGEGNSYLPLRNSGKGHYSQQIYTQSELNCGSGQITSISFRKKKGTNSKRNTAIYIENTTKTSFSGDYDWVTLSTGFVYDGVIDWGTGDDKWVEITLNTPFDYTGGNILLTVYDYTDASLGFAAEKFYNYTTENRCLSAINPATLSEGRPKSGEYNVQGSKLAYNNQISFTFQQTGPVLAKPTEVNASKTSLYPGESTTISWTAADGATAYNVYVGNEKVAEGVTSPYTLEGLTYNVDPGHNITVTAIHSEGESAKSNAVNVKMTAKSDVTITVKNPAGAAIEGATVRLYNGQDQYGVAIDEQTFTTNEDGQVVTQLLYLQNNYNYNMEVSKSPYKTDSEQYISYSLLNNPTYTKEITLQLPAPTGVYASPTSLYPGESTTISWKAAEGATSYNVYVGDTKVAEGVTSPYILSGLTYNVNPGHNITVTAVHAEGESAKSDDVNVKMTAKSNVTITVKDPAGTAIQGATVRIYGGYDQYYKTIAEQIFTTNENGQIITELLYLYNYCNYSMEVSKSPYVTNNTDMYYYYVNNGMYSNIITLSMSAPTNLVADDYSLYPDENVKLTWAAISGAQYNVYKRGAYSYETYDYEYTLLNTEGPLSEASFSFNAPEYNSSGYYYSVEAVYPEGVSSKVTLATPIKVTGYGIVSGMVTDGTNPIESAEVALVGTDEFGADKTYTFFTDEDGNYFSEEVLVGTYNVTASKIDYKSVTSTLNVVYGGELTYGDFTLKEKPEATISVTATQSGNNIVVSWEADYDKYNVYRRNVTTGKVETLATNVTEKEYTDTDWLNMGGATYQYGVSAKMNGETETVLNEGFENGSTPSGWSNTSNYYNYPIYFYKGSYYAHSGEYGAYLYTSGSYIYTLTTSEVNLEDYLSADLTFYYNIKAGSYGNHILNVKVNVIGEDTWETIATINTITNEYTLSENTLNKFAGKRIKIAFEFNTVSYAAAYLDDIVITGAPLSESKASWSTNLENENPLRFNNAAGDNKWNNTANWTCGVLPTVNKEVVIAAEAHINSEVNVMNLTLDGGMLRLQEGALLAVTGTFTDKNDTGWLYGGSVFIYDGAQLVQNNTKLKATFIMNIVNPSDEDMSNWANPEAMAHTGWQFIASPVANVGYSILATDGGMYDLYKYDGLQGNREWLNYKESAAPFGSYFEVGVGYLASHATKETISMLGTLNGATSHTYTVSYNSEKPLANFHLLGNPFTFNMDWDNVALTNVYDGFATIDPEEGGYIKSIGAGTIPVGDGFFVEAIGENPSISYPKQSKSRGEDDKADYINLIATGAEGSNNLIVKFSGAEEKGFSKLENINPNIADIYVKNNGRQYSILGYDQDVEEIEVFFAAKEMGNYSISFDINGNFENVVLVDRLTGIETNMLLEDEYTFVASSNDNPNRFVVRLEDNGQQPTANSHFAYVNNGDIVIYDIEGNANITIFDAMGRCVYNGESSEMTARIANSFNAGVYVIQKVDDNGVKVQKVIID